MMQDFDPLFVKFIEDAEAFIEKLKEKDGNESI